MSKEVYIALIQKDIKELDVIAQGLYETDFPSPTVIKLASSKAMDIVNNLQRLSAVKQEESKAEKENQEKLAAEAKAKAEKEEQERLAAEAKAKAEREKQERLAAEAKAKAEREEQERLAAEAKAKAEREEQERLAAEAKAKAEREEQERLAAEKAKAEREEQERLAAEAKAKAAAIINDHNKHSIIEEKIGNVESKIEQMSKEKGDSMADKIASSKISSIKSAISIADRFRFQRELFGGNADLMNSTLDRLDACSTIEEAEDIINDFTEWNPEDENVNDFLKLLGRRF